MYLAPEVVPRHVEDLSAGERQPPSAIQPAREQRPSESNVHPYESVTLPLPTTQAPSNFHKTCSCAQNACTDCCVLNTNTGQHPECMFG